MHDSIHSQAIELLLSSMSKRAEDGLRCSFLFGKPGAPPWDRRMVIEVFFCPKALTRAALFVRQHGPPYLRHMPLGDIRSMLQEFIVENYWYITEDTLFKAFQTSFAEQVSASTRENLSGALASSSIFKPRSSITLFPLVTIRVTDDFVSESFSFVSPGGLTAIAAPFGVKAENLAPDSFPPLAKWDGRRERPLSWLAVRSPVAPAAEKLKAAILGAISLTSLPDYRYQCSMRQVFGGRCTIADSISTSFGNAHTPPLAYDVVITLADHDWLRLLSQKLAKPDPDIRREIKALEYIYRSWDLGPSERFPVLCMAFDALFGDAGGATKAFIDGVRATLGHSICEKRLRELARLRASVIHGGAPDVYDSSKYPSYYDTYEADPIFDLELLAATCLRQKMFGEVMAEHADPNAEIIAEAIAKGRYPKTLPKMSII